MKIKFLAIIIIVLMLNITLTLGANNISKLDDECNCGNEITNNKNTYLNNTTLSFMLHNFRIRSYLTHLPSNYSNETEFPLVIVLHSLGNSALHVAKRSEMNNKSDEENFIAVYPDGATGLFFRLYNRLISEPVNGRAWDVEYCCWMSSLLNVDDVGFIDALIEKMETEYEVNSSRIYVTGFSNGGLLTYNIGAYLSHKIAAIAPVCAVIGGTPNDFQPVLTPPKPSDPLPVIAFNGLLDNIVKYEGGKSDYADDSVMAPTKLSINESINFWVENNNCNLTPTLTNSGNITIRTYGNGTNGSEVILYTVNNGGHWWFGGIALDNGPHNDPYKEISATDLMWEFFEKHPKK